MFRKLAVIIFLTSATEAFAVPIQITGASATYWTTTDELEFRFMFDRELRLGDGDYFSFSGWRPAEFSNSPLEESFRFRSDQVSTPESFDVYHITYFPSGGINQRVLRGPLQYEIQGRLLTATAPFSLFGFDAPLFAFETAASGPGSQAVPLIGFSHIDERVVYTPEPTSFVSAVIGVVAIGGCLWFARRRRRQALASDAIAA